MTDSELEELATAWICPNTRISTTPYEINAIKNLIRFARTVLEAAKVNHLSKRVDVTINAPVATARMSITQQDIDDDLVTDPFVI